MIGLLLALPFVIANFIVSLQIEPFYSFLESFPVIRNSPVLPLVLLLLFPLGAFISIREEKSALNIIVAAVLIIVFIPLFFGLAEEMYRCDILKIPDCD